MYICNEGMISFREEAISIHANQSSTGKAMSPHHTTFLFGVALPRYLLL